MAFQLFRVSLLLIALQTFAVADVEFDSDPDVRWENFKKSYQKTYEAEMESMKRKNFETNYQKITSHNLGNKSFQLGCNEFADMIIEEFLEMFTGLIPRVSNAPIPYVAPTDADVPDSVDWRNASAVTPVKNQGQCGSCYAFSATGALEGQTKIKTGTLVSLSEQNIIDCSMLQGNMGCGGGDMDAAFEYIMKNNGIDSEESYPYREKVGLCRYKRRNRAATCSGYSDITPSGDEDILKTAVATVGPISVGIDASHDSFQLYKGGIYDEPECSSTELDHGVLLVGYGSENGMDYWIIKNSWGTSWGEDGYMRMARNKNNQCGIATQASFPVV